MANIIIKPRKTDVLLGRGRAIAYWSGNVAFRAIVENHSDEYRRREKKDKHKVAVLVLAAVEAQSPPGRFLKNDVLGKGFKEVSRTKALEKIRQTLRDTKPLVGDYTPKAVAVANKQKIVAYSTKRVYCERETETRGDKPIMDIYSNFKQPTLFAPQPTRTTALFAPQPSPFLAPTSMVKHFVGKKKLCNSIEATPMFHMTRGTVGVGLSRAPVGNGISKALASCYDHDKDVRASSNEKMLSQSSLLGLALNRFDTLRVSNRQDIIVNASKCHMVSGEEATGSAFITKTKLRLPPHIQEFFGGIYDPSQQQSGTTCYTDGNFAFCESDLDDLADLFGDVGQDEGSIFSV